jgi:hypothetical protein
MVFFSVFFQYFDFIQEVFLCLKNMFYIWRKHFHLNFDKKFSPNSLFQKIVYFQYFNFHRSSYFLPQKNFTLGKKKHFSLFFFNFFPPNVGEKKTIQKNISPIKTLSTQPLGGLAVDFENFTFFS